VPVERRDVDRREVVLAELAALVAPPDPGDA